MSTCPVCLSSIGRVREILDDGNSIEYDECQNCGTNNRDDAIQALDYDTDEYVAELDFNNDYYEVDDYYD